MVTSKTGEIDEQELAEQMEAATQSVQETIGRLLRDDDIHPHVVVLTVARVAGELRKLVVTVNGLGRGTRPHGSGRSCGPGGEQD